MESALTPRNARPLQISVVTETYPPEINGVALTVERMVEGLKKRQHSLQLIRLKQGELDRPKKEDNFEQILQSGIPIPNYDGLKMGLPARGALLRLWSAKRPDIVHISTEGPLGWSALSAAKKLGIPVSSEFHTNFHNYSKHYGIGWLRKPIASYLRKFHNKADCTIVSTPEMERTLENLGIRKLIIVPRGVDAKRFNPAKRSADLRREWGVGLAQPVCMYVGRVAPEKNLDLLVQTVERMRAAQPALKFVLVGDGPERKALEKSHPQYIFAGMRTGEDLAIHYASADIFLFPSLTETFGNVVVEAMASGLAVVAFNYAAAAQHIGHGDNGLLAHVGSCSEFMRLAVDLVNDPSCISNFGSKARKSMESLDLDNVNKRIETVFMNTVGGIDHAAN
ncbi:MAG: glycosyltransferase family 1 protein [Burkholderiales bacterium]|nr:glycosyltransferase family 1 protein [Burkholderiales bacterium]